MKRHSLIVPFGVLLTLSFILAACGGEEAKEVKLGDQTFHDKGTKDVSGMASLEIEADSYYFEPTFVRGTAGQKLKLELTNESGTLHNFSIPGQLIDQDIAAKSSIEVNVTLPQSGVLLFLCKLHTALGMNGELLVGNAEPQAASAATVAPTIKVRDAGELGKILVDNAGRTLYLYKNDLVGSGKSAVAGNLAVSWPPLTLAAGEPLKKSHAQGDLTLITRDDGTKQVVYNGTPLYYYAQDMAAGDINGQARGNVWFVLNP